MKLWDYLSKKMKDYSDRIAFSGTKLTYKDLLNFASIDTGSEECCLCEGPTRERHAIEIVKRIAAGKVVVPISREYGDGYCENIRKAVKAVKDKNIKGVAFIMFTSGTTGEPKGVMLTDNNIITNLKYIGTYFNVEKSSSICIARPLVHISVIVGELLYALCKGMTINFYEEPFMPKRLLRYLVDYEIDILCATPTLFEKLAVMDTGHKLSIKTGVISGEVLSLELGRYLSEKYPSIGFYNVYGLTEHSPRVSALLPTDFKKRPNSIGKPIGKVKMKLVKNELFVKSPCVMKGYLEDKVNSRKKKIAGWLRTGDYAHKDAEGFYYIDGRKDSMIIRAGLNIFPEEIEIITKQITEIEDCFVCSEKNNGREIIIMRYVGTIEPKELRKIMINKMNPNIIPDRIEKVSFLSTKANGKKCR